MHSSTRSLSALLAGLLLVGFSPLKLAFAQPIQAADDGTNTEVTSDGNRFEIDGGTLSGDGENLFHSFEQFGLDPGQIADYGSTEYGFCEW